MLYSGLSRSNTFLHAHKLAVAQQAGVLSRGLMVHTSALLPVLTGHQEADFFPFWAVLQ